MPMPARGEGNPLAKRVSSSTSAGANAEDGGVDVSLCRPFDDLIRPDRFHPRIRWIQNRRPDRGRFSTITIASSGPDSRWRPFSRAAGDDESPPSAATQPSRDRMSDSDENRQTKPTHGVDATTIIPILYTMIQASFTATNKPKSNPIALMGGGWAKARHQPPLIIRHEA